MNVIKKRLLRCEATSRAEARIFDHEKSPMSRRTQADRMTPREECNFNRNNRRYSICERVFFCALAIYSRHNAVDIAANCAEGTDQMNRNS